MASSLSRVSRGFHRLALFLAAIPLLVGGVWSLTIALGEANSAKGVHDQKVKLACARTALKNAPAPQAQSGAMIDAAGEKGQDKAPTSPKGPMGTYEVTRGSRVFQVDANSPDEAGQKADAIVASTPAPAPISKHPNLPPLPPGYHLDDEQIDLQKLGCSEWAQTASYGEVFSAQPPDDFSYTARFLPPLGLGLAITLAVTLAVYGVVRAIGWVIGGFVAS